MGQKARPVRQEKRREKLGEMGLRGARLTEPKVSRMQKVWLLYENNKMQNRICLTLATLCSHYTECFPDSISTVTCPHSRSPQCPDSRSPWWSMLFFGHHSVVQNRPTRTCPTSCSCKKSQETLKQIHSFLLH